MEEMAHLDPEDPNSPEVLADIYHRIDGLRQQYRRRNWDRTPPNPPHLGRRPEITRIRAENPNVNGEVFEGAIHEDAIWPNSLFNVSSVPNWVAEALEKDFAGLSEEEMWDELRSRRFALAMLSKQSDKAVLMKLAADQAADGQRLDEYMRDTTFREKPIELRYMWSLDTAGSSLEYGEQCI